MRRIALVISCLLLVSILLGACESLGEDAANAIAQALSTGVQINVDANANLGADTLSRIDAINQTLNSGVEVGPETRKVIQDLNNTLKQGLKVGFDEATLARVDQLLSIIEQGIHIQVGLDNNTLTSVNRLLDELDEAPDRWQSVAENVITTLEGSTSKVAKEMANQVKSVLNEARLNLQQIMAAAGTEMRCNVDFLGSRAGSTLSEFMGRSIIGKLHDIIEGKSQSAAKSNPIPWVCQIIPDQIQMKTAGNQLLAEKPVVILTGYNFSDTNNPQVYLADESGQPVQSVKLYAFRQSSYQIQLNLQEIDFSTLPARSRVVFKWPNVTDTTALALLRPEAGITPTPGPQLTMTAQSKIYQGPSTKYNILGTADKGAIYALTGRNGDSSWYQIQFDHKSGWVPASASSKNVQDIPVATLPLPPPTADFKGSGTTGPAPLTVAFTDLSTDAPTKWKWDFGDGAVSMEQNPSHTYANPARYKVSLTVSNSQGSDTKSVEKFVTVNAPPPGPVAAFHVTMRNGTAPFTTHFYDDSSGSPTSWTWNFGDGKTSTERNPMHTYTDPGSYTVSLKVKNAQGEHTRTVTDYMIISPKPTLPPCYSIKTSEEYGQVSCQSGFAVNSMKCEAAGCDNMIMTCCPYMSGTDSSLTYIWTQYLKSGTPDYKFVSAVGFLWGLQAKGAYSEQVTLKIMQSKNLKHTGACQTLELFSEGQTSTCSQGSWVAGLECWGDYCGSIRLTCCVGGK